MLLAVACCVDPWNFLYFGLAFVEFRFCICLALHVEAFPDEQNKWLLYVCCNAADYKGDRPTDGEQAEYWLETSQKFSRQPN